MSRLLFLSHSGIDTVAAKALKERLLAVPTVREQGLGVWFDKDDLHAGKPWQSQLEEAVGASHAFAVYVGSKGVVNWVEAEVRLALNRAITEPDYRFVPILAAAAPGPESLPGFAQQFQGVFDVESQPDQFEALVRAVLGADFDRNESRILTWSSDGTARLWDVARLRGRHVIEIACGLLPSIDTSELEDRYGIAISEPICGPDMPAPIWSSLED